MAVTIVCGKNFSGRSDALRAFAWADVSGQYLHPDLELNLSGLATTVGGESFLHGLGSGAGNGKKLLSLSGGERSQLVLDCALATRPRRLAIDCALEQLDGSRRKTALDRLQQCSEATEVWLADNGLTAASGAVQECSRPDAFRPDFNGGLTKAAAVIEAMAGSSPTLRLDDVTFRYGRKSAPIFADSSFEFQPGQMYVLKAANGSGKSTLAKLLVGVLRPVSGAVLVDSRLLDSGGSSPLFYAFQNGRDQVFGKSPGDYLERVQQLAQSRRPHRFPIIGVADAVHLFGLAPFAGLDLWDLPPVAIKRLGLAASFCSGAPWLFLDEPALGLDEEGRAGLAALLSAAAKAGRGIVVVTHGSEFDELRDARPITIQDRRLQGGGAAWT